MMSDASLIQLHDDLQRMVVKCDNLSLLHTADVDLKACLPDQDNGCDVDEDIGQRI